MKNNLSSLIWGIALIAGGGIFLASNYNLIPHWDNNPNFWIPFLLAISALFLATFVLNGRSQWGLLFPASISAGQALTIWLASSSVESAAVAFPTLFSAAVPFFAGYLLDRSRKALLIPAWIITALAGMMLFVDSVQGEFIPLYIMMAAALPFLYGGFTNPQRRGLLIPGGVLALVGVLPIVLSNISGAMAGPFVMFVIALPFIVTAAWSRKNWWAIIPAGIMLSIGLAIIISGVTTSPDEAGLAFFSEKSDEAKAGILAGVMFLGWAATFGLLWLMHGSTPTGWAAYPAAALALIGGISVAMGANSLSIAWPIVLIAGGLLILARSMRRPAMN